MHVKPHHPLQELLAKLLFSIDTVSFKEQRKMVNRACKEASEWHEAQVKIMRRWIKDFEYLGRFSGESCPCCCMELTDDVPHSEGCELGIMVSDDCIGP